VNTNMSEVRVRRFWFASTQHRNLWSFDGWYPGDFGGHPGEQDECCLFHHAGLLRGV